MFHHFVRDVANPVLHNVLSGFGLEPFDLSNEIITIDDDRVLPLRVVQGR
jgi:hypothetical protein